MGYFLAFAVGLAFSFAVINWDNIRSDYIRNRKIKRYQKLLNGIPKHAVFITTWDELWHYRDYPLYINGEMLGIVDFYRWHCNDEFKSISDKDKNHIGYIKTVPVRRYKDNNGREKVLRMFCIATNGQSYGPIVQPCVVLEVY